MNQLLERAINKGRHTYRVQRDQQGSAWDMAPRLADLRSPVDYAKGAKLFRPLIDEDFTMISARRGRALYRMARDADRRGVPGAIVDCGVWNGGSTVLLHNGAPSREVWAFDSFEGLPEPGDKDGAESKGWAGECLGAEERLREGFARFGDPSRLHVVKGWFDQTFPQVAPEIDEVAVLHADGDWYDSVLLTLRTFYPRVPSGGWIAIDDYGHWIGAQRATDEFRREVGDSTPMQRIDYSGRCWRKP